MSMSTGRLVYRRSTASLSLSHAYPVDMSVQMPNDIGLRSLVYAFWAGAGSMKKAIGTLGRWCS